MSCTIDRLTNLGEHVSPEAAQENANVYELVADFRLLPISLAILFFSSLFAVLGDFLFQAFSPDYVRSRELSVFAEETVQSFATVGTNAIVQRSIQNLSSYAFNNDEAVTAITGLSIKELVSRHKVLERTRTPGSAPSEHLADSEREIVASSARASYLSAAYSNRLAAFFCALCYIIAMVGYFVIVGVQASRVGSAAGFL